MRIALLAASSAFALTLASAGHVLAQEAEASPAQTAANGQSVLVFTPDFFAAQRPNTALDMVNRVPGFRLDDGDSVRGFAGSAGNALIDGARPAARSDSVSSALSRTPASRVERIELIRGGAAGVDMQGHPVVVNVILRAEATSQHVVSVTPLFFEGGPELLRASYEFSANDNGREWGFSIGRSAGMDDGTGAGFMVRRAANGALLSDEPMETYFDSHGHYARANWAGPVAGGRLELTGEVGQFHWDSGARFGQGATFRRSHYGETENEFDVGVRYERPLGENLRLEARLMQSLESGVGVSTSRGVGPDQEFRSDYDTGESIARVSVRWERSPTLSFEWGGELAYNFLDTVQSFSVGGVDVPLPSASVKVEELRGELFGQTVWRASETVTVEAGVRLEQSTISQSGDADSEKDFFFAKPRLQVAWTPWTNNQFRFRFERELGQLDFDDFAASASLSNDQVFGGNVDLEPEERWIAEAVYELRFWNEGAVTVGYRHDRIENVIDRIPLQGGHVAVGNIGEGTLERLSANIVIPMDRMGFSGGRFTFRNDWNATEVTDPTTGERRPISGVRASQAVIALSQDVPAWKLNWSLAWIPRLGQGTYGPDQTFIWRGADYLELVAEYKPTPSLSLRAQLNVWDEFAATRTVFADHTAARPVSFIETRDTDPRVIFSLRLRKTF